MLARCNTARVARATGTARLPSRRTVVVAASKPSAAAATSVIPIQEVQVTEQPTGFFGSISQMFNQKHDESHDDDHAHNHVMFHSHIAEMLAMEPAKSKSAAVAKTVQAHADDAHLHEDHAHAHTMFHSHIANAKAMEE